MKEMQNMKTINICILLTAINAFAFKDSQMRYVRYRNAVRDYEEVAKSLFAEKSLPYPPKEIYIRAFKLDKIVELWATDSEGKFVLVRDYSVCALSGGLGPKRKQGDYQIPEGFYYVDRFNPVSNFHLSLGINYPNESDKRLGVKGKLGGDIFIHGDCVTIGCLPLGDAAISELYVIAVEAKENGQRRIPVHIFPFNFDLHTTEAIGIKYKNKRFYSQLWPQLEAAFHKFNMTKTLPSVRVRPDGSYSIK